MLQFKLIILTVAIFTVAEGCASSRFNNIEKTSTSTTDVENHVIDKCMERALQVNETLSKVAANFVLSPNNTDLMTQFISQLVQKCIDSDFSFVEFDKMTQFLQKIPKPLPFTLLQPLFPYYLIKALLETF